MKREIQTVALDRIDLTDRTFQITTVDDKSDLTPSIHTVGLLQPPILLPKTDRMIVVCGFRRLAALRELNRSRVPAWLLDADHPETECARLAIVDNTCQRSLNLVEQARALVCIRDTADGPDTWVAIAERVGLPVGKGALNRLLPLADMAPPLQKGVVRGLIALPVALQIHAMPSEDATVLTAFFLSMGAGLNVQRELFERIVDISRRDRIAIAALLGQPAVSAIMASPTISGPQRVQQLRRFFKEQRYPELSKTETRFREMITGLQLDPRLQLQAPPFFEGPTYRLVYSFHSRNQLKTLRKELERLIQHPHLLPE